MMYTADFYTTEYNTPLIQEEATHINNTHCCGGEYRFLSHFFQPFLPKVLRYVSKWRSLAFQGSSPITWEAMWPLNPRNHSLLGKGVASGEWRLFSRASTNKGRWQQHKSFRRCRINPEGQLKVNWMFFNLDSSAVYARTSACSFMTFSSQGTVPQLWIS